MGADVAEILIPIVGVSIDGILNVRNIPGHYVFPVLAYTLIIADSGGVSTLEEQVNQILSHIQHFGKAAAMALFPRFEPENVSLGMIRHTQFR